MNAFLCKEILYQNLFKSNHPESFVNEILSKHGYQVAGCGKVFSSLEELVDCNRESFGTDFSSFTSILEGLASNAPAQASSPLSSRKIQHFLRKSRDQISQITQQKSLSSIQGFLFIVAEVQRLRIKLFNLDNGVLSTQTFGSKSARKICLISESGAVRMVEAADSDCPAVALSLTRALASDSELSVSDLGELALSLKKETSAEKETLVDTSSIHENIKQVHEELFGDDMFDNFSRSDDNDNDHDLNASFQSQNLRSKKEKSAPLRLNNSSFNFSLQDAVKPVDQEAAKQEIIASIMNNGTKGPRQSAGNKKFQSKVIFEEKNSRDGKVKFYSEESDFGFLITKEGEEFFVHGDDLAKDGFDTKKLAFYARCFDIEVQFRFIQYQGKTKVNRKAVDVKITKLSPLA